jgi:hypothetical protein
MSSEPHKPVTKQDEGQGPRLLVTAVAGICLSLGALFAWSVWTGPSVSGSPTPHPVETTGAGANVDDRPTPAAPIPSSAPEESAPHAALPPSAAPGAAGAGAPSSPPGQAEHDPPEATKGATQKRPEHQGGNSGWE